MARLANRLTAQRIARLDKAGQYADGDGLYLAIDRAGTRSWKFRYRVGGADHWCGLGPIRDVSLAEAREAARDCRRMLRAGLDPIETRRRQRAEARAGAAGETFAEVATLYIDAHRAGWRSPKHAAQWRTTLETYAFPVMGDLPVAAVGVAHVMRVLEPIWREKPETASRVRGRIEALLDYATARGWRTGDNPARWRGHLDNLLPARAKVQRVQHHAAMPWRDLPALIARLRGADNTDTSDKRRRGVASWCLEWTILTACRSGEARGATWVEIDLAGAVWTIPGQRMKGGRDHRVPLSDAALDLLRAVAPLRAHPGPDALLFPGGRPGRPLSDVALADALAGAGGESVTVHGMRSAFRDWCAEATNYPREIAEAALAHANRDKTEAAYARTDHMERRRRLMGEWAGFLARPMAEGAEVVPIRA